MNEKNEVSQILRHLIFLHTAQVASLAVSHDVRTEAEAGREARKGDKKSAKIIGGGVFSAY